ncbi:MAG: hypothetical protein EAZ89_07245 [Bacteroidetes bacterium]|nr:MAG: hypothetical protein EAZ89_07245 [Bacteroidota bacterium]
MPIDALSILFEKYKQTIKGVILNACYTADSAKTISQHGMYVVGMDSPINDDAAIRFAVGFYKALNRSEGYEEAFESGLLLMISPEESVASRSLSLPDSAQKSCMATLWKDGKQLYPVS